MKRLLFVLALICVFASGCLQQEKKISTTQTVSGAASKELSHLDRPLPEK